MINETNFFIAFSFLVHNTIQNIYHQYNKIPLKNKFPIYKKKIVFITPKKYNNNNKKKK